MQEVGELSLSFFVSLQLLFSLPLIIVSAVVAHV